MKTKTKAEKEFEVDGEKFKDLFEEGKRRKLVFTNKEGEVVISMVLVWAMFLAMLLWPLFVFALILTVATGGSVKIEKKKV